MVFWCHNYITNCQISITNVSIGSSAGNATATAKVVEA